MLRGFTPNLNLLISHVLLSRTKLGLLKHVWMYQMTRWGHWASNSPDEKNRWREEAHLISWSIEGKEVVCVVFIVALCRHAACSRTCMCVTEAYYGVKVMWTDNETRLWRHIYNCGDNATFWEPLNIGRDHNGDSKWLLSTCYSIVYQALLIAHVKKKVLHQTLL